jgi:hypothetical protein
LTPCKPGDNDEPSSTTESSDAEDDSFEALTQNSRPYAAADAAMLMRLLSAPLSSAAAPTDQQRTRRRSHTQITLITLFDFNTAWILLERSHQNTFELAFVQEGLQVPGMPDASSIASTSSLV